MKLNKLTLGMGLALMALNSALNKNFIKQGLFNNPYKRGSGIFNGFLISQARKKNQRAKIIRRQRSL